MMQNGRPFQREQAASRRTLYQEISGFPAKLCFDVAVGALPSSVSLLPLVKRFIVLDACDTQARHACSIHRALPSGEFF